MNNPNEIDKLLKDSFEHFAPDAPDVWQGIIQGVQATQGAATTASVATVAKTTAVVIKAITALMTVAGLVAAYVVYQQLTEPPAAVQQEVVIAPIEETIAQPERMVETPMERGSEINQPSQPSAKQPSAKTHTEVSKEVTPAQSLPVSTTGVGQAGIKTQDQQQLDQQPASAPSAQVPTTVVTPKLSEEKPSTETKETPEPSEAKLPYNPNEGERGFDKSNIPNVFTPNNDGANDHFVIEIEQEVLYHLIITDANGRMIFESYDKTNTWDGKDFRTGVQCQNGKYRWTFQYQFKESDKLRTINGLVQIIN